MYPEIYIDYAIRLLEAAKRQKAKARKRRKLLESDEGFFTKVKNFFKNIWEKIKSFFRMVKEKIVSFWNRITGKTEAELRKKLDETQKIVEEKTQEVVEKTQKIVEYEAKQKENESKMAELEKQNIEKDRIIAKLEKEKAELEKQKKNLIKALDKEYESGAKDKKEIERLEKELKDVNEKINSMRLYMARDKETIQDLERRLRQEEEKQVIRGRAYDKIEKHLDEMKKRYKNTKSIFGILEKFLIKCEEKFEVEKDCKKARHYLYIAQAHFHGILSDERISDLEKLLKTMFFGHGNWVLEGFFDKVGSALKSGAIFLVRTFVSLLKIAAIIFIMILAIDLIIYVAKKVKNMDLAGIGEKLRQIVTLNPTTYSELFEHLLSRAADAAVVALFVKLFAVAIIVVAKVYKKFVGRGGSAEE